MDIQKKSYAGSFFLCLFLGPIGTLYSAPIAAIVLIVLFIVLLPTIFGAFAIWILAIAIGHDGVTKHNKNVDHIIDLMKGRGV